MKKISGFFNGTGAVLYVGCGFLPDKVVVRNVVATTCLVAKWSRFSRSLAQIDGVLETQGVSAAVAAAAGIEPYVGGDVMTAANQTDVTYGGGIFIMRRLNEDYRGNDPAFSDVSPGSPAIDTWTLDTLANRTGHFNNDVVGAMIGAGSEICIGDGNGKSAVWYTILALTAGQGITADEVTLDRAAPSGKVLAIKGKYDFSPVPIGSVCPAGFKIINTTLNGNDQGMVFEAEQFDL